MKEPSKALSVTPKTLTIMVVALHRPPRGYLGGGWLRLIEFLRRAKEHGLHYVLLETAPTFAETHQISYDAIRLPPITDLGSIAHVLFEALRAGTRLAAAVDVDFIYSPVEVEYSVWAAYLLSRLCRKPWLVNLQSLPGFGTLLPDSHPTISFHQLYINNRLRTDSVLTAVLQSLAQISVYRLLRRVRAISPGKSVAEDAATIDNRIQVFPILPGNGIDLERIDRVPQGETMYDCIFASMLLREKGIFDLLKIWSIVARKKRNIVLAVVGKGNPATISEMRRVIRRLGIEENVVFPFDPQEGATREDVWAHMKRSRVFVYPSYFEAWPLVIGEALGCGLPVVCYDVKPVRYAYGECPGVFMVPKGDFANFATKIEMVLKEKPRNYGLRAYLKRLAWSSVVESERRAYLEMLSSRSSLGHVAAEMSCGTGTEAFS